MLFRRTLDNKTRGYLSVFFEDSLPLLELLVELVVLPPQPMAKMANMQATRDNAINFFTRTILSILIANLMLPGLPMCPGLSTKAKRVRSNLI
jgi:hypothetical protein